MKPIVMFSRWVVLFFVTSPYFKAILYNSMIRLHRGSSKHPPFLTPNRPPVIIAGSANAGLALSISLAARG
jgi:hypothetical protein